MFHKSSLLKVLTAGLLLTGMAACEKGINDDILTPPAEVKVITPVSVIGKYFITETPNTFRIPVGFTTVSNKDRTVTFTYNSRTAVQGTHYNAPQTITIPAGQAADTIEVAGVFSAYAGGRRDTLKISVSSPDASTAYSDNTYSLVMQQYCSVDLNTLSGVYANTMDGTYGPYSVNITAGTATGTKGYILVENVWDPGVPVTVRVNLDWTDPANFSTSVPDQEFSGDWWIVGTTNGTFSSCDQTFRLRYKLYRKSTGAVLYNNQVTDIKR